MDAPPQHTYMRPPQSYMSDLQQQQVAPPRPPPANWYPPNNNNNNNNQFQYQHNHSSYPTPQPPPYPTQPQNHYYPPPPPPPPPQSYPQQSLYSQPPPPPHQTWGNPNWAQQNVWPHPDRMEPNINELDWAAKARAWAAAKSAGDSQHQQSQSTQIGRPEEHNHDFHGQYQQTVDPHYANIQQQPLPASSHQQFMGDPYMVPANHQQESLSFSSGPSLYYPSDLQVSYTSRDGALAPDPSPYLHQANILTNSSIYQQEVPYSYSSAPGNALL
ncbi:hypothetical protein IFM89_031076 [Coptis chinensis]|uniref:Uncharacterized protein n=1 Tax=Coptis chinensis TaxID=261450 RepID=A0A835LTK8_9MAGN|nr:hypothetical protein IFM89_031076 [Coptis chinensis]